MKKIIIAALTSVCAALGCSASDNSITGSWDGTLKVTPQMSLKLVLNLKNDSNGKPTATLDSPDQGAYGIPGEVNFISADSVNISVSRIGASFAGRKVDNKIVGKFSQGPINVDLVLTAKPLNRPQTPQPPFPYSTKEVSFSNPTDKGVTLAGTLTLPDNFNESTPTVVMITGSGLQNRDEEIFDHKPFAVIADFLARNGIASLRYDDRGCGSSTGNGSVATTATFATDAKAAVDHLRRNEHLKNIGILGHSEGASIAFLLGANNDTDLSCNPNFIVAIGAQAVRGDSILIDQSATMLRQSNIPTGIVNEYVDALHKLYAVKIARGNDAAVKSLDTICSGMGNTPVHASLKNNLQKIAGENSPWLAGFIGFSPAESIASTKCPTLVLYGEKDIQIRPELNMPAMQRLAPKAKLKLYPGLNHLFQHAQTGSPQEYGTIDETISPEVLGDIADFIKKSTL